MSKSREEKWISVKGFEGLYEVSNLGRIKSLTKIVWNGKGYYTKKESFIKPSVNKGGYLHTRLCKNGKLSSFTVHRLVAESFVSNDEGKPQVNHIDGDKENNAICNLEWCTNYENYKHAVENGLKDMKKVSIESVKKSRRGVSQIDISSGLVIFEFKSIMDAQRAAGVPNSHIVRVCKGKLNTAGGYKWRYIP